MSEDGRIVPVILSGGAGTRLWPLSRAARPKQMLDLAGGGSMLAMTAARVADPDLFAPPIVVAGAGQADAIAAEISGTLILEPAARNTAPAIALAALDADPDDVLLVLPSDHLIADAAGFVAAVRRGLPFARDGWIVTFGMKAERAETGYGYIERAGAIGEGVFAAARFVEKPDADTAALYVTGGIHDWNGGIFLMRAGTYVEALAAHAPDILQAAEAAMTGATVAGERIHPDPAAFRDSPSLSIDYAVMEKAAKVAVVPSDVGWSDVGSWQALYEVSPRDEDGNALSGETMAIDARGNLIRSDGPLITAIGVENLVIVATGDSVLVVPRDQCQRVKDAVDRLKEQGNDKWI